jgi:hypothetical protein
MPKDSSNPNPAGPLAVSTAIAAAIIRTFALLPNVSPVGGLALYSGSRLRWWLAWVPPLAVMAISDVILSSLYAKTPFDPWVYGSLLVYVVIGMCLTRTITPLRVGAAGLLGAVQFFLITNFGVWYSQHGLANPMYPPTLAGLIACYVAGLPFLGYTLLGDLGFSTVLFGAHAYLTRTAPAPVPETEEVRA